MNKLAYALGRHIKKSEGTPSPFYFPYGYIPEKFKPTNEDINAVYERNWTQRFNPNYYRPDDIRFTPKPSPATTPRDFYDPKRAVPGTGVVTGSSSDMLGSRLRNFGSYLATGKLPPHSDAVRARYAINTSNVVNDEVRRTNIDALNAFIRQRAGKQGWKETYPPQWLERFPADLTAYMRENDLMPYTADYAEKGVTVPPPAPFDEKAAIAYMRELAARQAYIP